MKTHDVESLFGWNQQLNALALSSDGSRFAVGGGAKVARLFATDGELERELPHFSAVKALSFSPDGSRLASGSDDMGVRVFSRDGELIALAKGHTHSVVDVTWHADGERLASASNDGSVRVWLGKSVERTLDDLGATPAAVAWLGDELLIGTESSVVITGPSRRSIACAFVRQLAASPSGLTFVTLTSTWIERVRHDSITLYSRDGELLWQRPARAFAFHAETGELGIADGGALVVFEADSARERFVAKVHEGNIECVCSTIGAWVTGGTDASVRVVSRTGSLVGMVAHDGALSFCASAGERVVSLSRNGESKVWEIPEARTARAPAPAKQPFFRVKLEGGANAVAFSPDGSRVAVATVHGLELRDAKTGALVETLGTAAAWGLEWTSTFLRACFRDGEVWQATLWNGDTLAHVMDIPQARNIEVFGDRILIALVDDTQLTYRVENGKLEQLSSAPADGYGCSITKDQRFFLFAAKSGAILFDLETGEKRTLTQRKTHSSSISPNGRFVILSADGKSELFDARSGEVVPFDVKAIWRSAWSPSGDRVAVADSDGCVHLFDGDLRCITRLSPDRMRGHDLPQFFANGSRLVTGGRHGGKAHLWRASDGERIAELGGIATSFIRAVVLGNETRVLTHSNVNPAEDLTLRLWDASGKSLAVMPGHEGDSFWQVIRSPCERFVVSLVWGDRPRVWSTETGELLGALDGHARELRGGRFSPSVDGNVTLATADSEGNFQLWQL